LHIKLNKIIKSSHFYGSFCCWTNSRLVNDSKPESTSYGSDSGSGFGKSSGSLLIRIRILFRIHNTVIGTQHTNELSRCRYTILNYCKKILVIASGNKTLQNNMKYIRLFLRILLVLGYMCRYRCENKPLDMLIKNFSYYAQCCRAASC
jgi:hypothetical protein